jgi:hypothetical protein
MPLLYAAIVSPHAEDEQKISRNIGRDISDERTKWPKHKNSSGGLQ